MAVGIFVFLWLVLLLFEILVGLPRVGGMATALASDPKWEPLVILGLVVGPVLFLLATGYLLYRAIKRKISSWRSIETSEDGSDAPVHHWKFWRHRPEIPRQRLHWWTKYDSPLLAAIVFVGIPMMGWTVSSFWTQVIIALIWITISSIGYYTIEGLEVTTNLDEEGFLNQKDGDAQRNSLQWPYWGVAGALVVYLLFAAIWAFTGIASLLGWYGIPGPLWYGPAFAGYGSVTALLAVHAGLLGYTTIKYLYPILSNLQLLSSKVRRVEQEARTAQGQAGH